MTILLGLTGSVASVLHDKLIDGLKTIGNVQVILTERARHFLGHALDPANTFMDKTEWEWSTGEVKDWQPVMRKNWQKSDRVLHIELRDKASALIIAPCSANTLAKLANGICDNLLTSVARAWDFNRPVIIAPAMNTLMWEHPTTKEHIAKLESWGFTIVPPQSKMLACGTKGMGAMASIEDIIKAVETRLRWCFPLLYSQCSGIPVGKHPGAFLFPRTTHTHTGVDLYTSDGQAVFAVENGKVVGIEDFTGKSQQTPWWEDTQCALVEGASGVVCYGEITPIVNVGDKICRGDHIGFVKRVLPLGKERPDIKGHSLSMLHIEIYPHGKYLAFEELGPKPDSFGLLIDPTPHLLKAEGAPGSL